MREEIEQQEPITLGELIRLLKDRPQDEPVRFDFGGFIPRDVDSYRGYYDQLAIGYDDDWHKERTVADLLTELRAANGKTFQGYKGGDFTMKPHTPVWVANYGRCHSTSVVGIVDCRFTTIIATGYYD